MEILSENGIGTQVHYIPVPTHPYYRKMGYDSDDFPQAMAFYGECLSLPMYSTLEASQVERVVKELLEALGLNGET